MPAKIARSAARPPLGLPEMLVAVHTSRLSCREAEKSLNFHAGSGVIWRIQATIRAELNPKTILIASAGDCKNLCAAGGSVIASCVAVVATDLTSVFVAGLSV